MADLFPLQGRTAVVTGSTRGIGLIMAQALIAAGANVVVSSRSETGAVCEQLERNALAPGTGQIMGTTCDVTSLGQVEQLAAKTIERFGQIDIWINNAGIASPYAQTLDIPIERWKRVVQTNLYGTYHGTTVALQHMLERNQGKIVNVFGAGDRDSRVDKYGYMSAYATSKSAVRRFTLVMAEEYKQTPISILGLRPGLVATDLMTKIEPLTDEAAQRLKGLSFALFLFTTPAEQIQTTIVKMVSSTTDGVSGQVYRCRVTVPTIVQRWIKRSR
ncbi:Glucose 1-dehydrogenase 2 [Acaryochloris thomasi RCC1774]|uniref:Glucose 1-dehydrogenase 2 n=1 Tax=Acaryochloris thomasi RCC1774 TaxID=1764569 RepID=A0A2W1JCY4_9CYAN|nr:SDR family oxidoreductase [Acaryochloris thomasi]PZD71648.1 Glucose 1-dehydrogenase 2 [Acaryochloris thomasi RCC1774]